MSGALTLGCSRRISPSRSRTAGSRSRQPIGCEARRRWASFFSACSCSTPSTRNGRSRPSSWLRRRALPHAHREVPPALGPRADGHRGAGPPYAPNRSATHTARQHEGEGERGRERHVDRSNSVFTKLSFAAIRTRIVRAVAEASSHSRWHRGLSACSTRFLSSTPSRLSSRVSTRQPTTFRLTAESHVEIRESSSHPRRKARDYPGPDTVWGVAQ